MKHESKTEVFITGHINVIEVSQPEDQWKKLWGVLAGGKLALSELKTSERPKYMINVENVELHPAVKETGRILAFKIVDKGQSLIILEPLNITDMGRWVSSLFAAIQGLPNYQLAIAKAERETKMQPSESKESDIQETVRKTSISQTSETKDILYTVKVKDLTKLFEQLASTNEAQKERHATVKRSMSNPNLTTRPPLAVNKPPVAEVVTVKKEEVKLIETMPDITETLVIKESATSTETQQNDTATILETVVSHQGAYLEQESEKAVLANLLNPVLAIKRYQKQKQLISRLEVTMKTVIEKVKRQQKSLKETEEAIKELESQSTTSDDYDDVAKLQAQKAQLQYHISQSETSIEEYKASIQEAEEELEKLSKVINDNLSMQTEKAYEYVTVIKKQIPVSIYYANDDHEELHQTNHFINSSNTHISNSKNEPEWIAKARRKSEVMQRLAEEGMLN
ncbi:hypothetical protein CHUAL_009087 [Chamberlinius hualienensis]